MSVTREKIMQLGEELIRLQGYNAFSYQDISSELGIKNAAVHYYFPSKENLGMGVLKNTFQRFEEMIDNMQNKKFNEWQQLETFMKYYSRSNREQKVCMIGSLGPDFYTVGKTIQDVLKKMTESIVIWMSELLKNGRNKGIFAFKGEPRDRALLIITNMVAGLQIARILDKNDFKNIYQAVLEDLRP